MANGQRTARGRLLITAGWTAGAVGSLLLLSANLLLQTFFVKPSDLPVELRVLIIVAVLGAGALVFGLSFPLVKHGKRHVAPTIASFTDLGRYVLYLRPFELDHLLAADLPDAPGWLMRSYLELPGHSAEQFLIRQFAPLGQVVAIGEPGQQLPQLGAHRGYLPTDEWQETASALIRGAHVVLMCAAPGAGTVWEFLEAHRHNIPTRLVLLVVGDPALYAAFRTAVAQACVLPSLPPLSPRGWEMPLQGIVTFDEEWRGSFTRFAPVIPKLRWVWTVRKLARRELAPVTGPLTRLPLVSGSRESK